MMVASGFSLTVPRYLITTSIVEIGEKMVLRVDGNHFSVKLSIIDHRKDAQDLYLMKFNMQSNRDIIRIRKFQSRSMFKSLSKGF